MNSSSNRLGWQYIESGVNIFKHHSTIFPFHLHAHIMPGLYNIKFLIIFKATFKDFTIEKKINFRVILNLFSKLKWFLKV